MPRSRHRDLSLWRLAGVAVALTGFGYVLFAPRREITSEESRIASAEISVANCSTAIEAFANDTGQFPTDSEGFTVLVSSPGGLSGWNGPYLQHLINDPWGHPFVYHRGGPKGGAGFRVLSMGGDGREGTRDDIVHGSDAAAVRIAPPVTRQAENDP